MIQAGKILKVSPYGPPYHFGTTTNLPAALGLEELFSTVLKSFLEPIHALRVYCKN